MDEQYAQHLIAKLEERKNSLIQHMAGGGCASLESYKELCGRVRGLGDAQAEINDLLRKLTKDDDDE